jgi:predicted transcriptional regulator
MPISIRLRPDVERLLEQRARREHKTRTALVHEALDAWLKPSSPGLGSAIRAALADTPDGFGIERNQPAEGDTRDWER